MQLRFMDVVLSTMISSGVVSGTTIAMMSSSNADVPAVVEVADPVAAPAADHSEEIAPIDGPKELPKTEPLPEDVQKQIDTITQARDEIMSQQQEIIDRLKTLEQLVDDTSASKEK